MCDIRFVQGSSELLKVKLGYPNLFDEIFRCFLELLTLTSNNSDGPWNKNSCCCCCSWSNTLVSRRAPDLKLGPLPLPSQRVLLLIAWIIHGRPVLNVSLTPLPPESTSCNAEHGCMNLVCLFRTGFMELHYTWVKAGLQGLAISDPKVARPL